MKGWSLLLALLTVSAGAAAPIEKPAAPLADVPAVALEAAPLSPVQAAAADAAGLEASRIQVPELEWSAPQPSAPQEGFAATLDLRAREVAADWRARDAGALEAEAPRASDVGDAGRLAPAAKAAPTRTEDAIPPLPKFSLRTAVGLTLVAGSYSDWAASWWIYNLPLPLWLRGAIFGTAYASAWGLMVLGGVMGGRPYLDWAKAKANVVWKKLRRPE